jgi:hypothetical protein
VRRAVRLDDHSVVTWQCQLSGNSMSVTMRLPQALQKTASSGFDAPQ